MLSARLFDALELISRSLRNDTRVFGGLQLVACGDFFQLPPLPNSYDVGLFLFESQKWKTVFSHMMILTIVVRQSEERLIHFLNDLREGRCDDESSLFAA